MVDFLNINGLRVPIDSCQETFNAVYGDTRAFNGQARKGRLAIKRQWQMKTTPLYIDDATSLAGILSLRSDKWTFDDLTVFSSKGVNSGYGFTAATLPSFITNSSAADGNFNPEAPPFSAYSIYGRYPIAGNLLAVNDATFEASGYNYTAGSNTSLATTTVARYQGAQCLYSYASSGGATVFTYAGSVSAAAGTAYTASILVYNPRGTSATLVLSGLNAAKSVLASTTCQMPSKSGWYRFAVTFSVSSAQNIYFSVSEAGAPAQGTMYYDAFQLEASSFASPWVIPGGTVPGVNTASTFLYFAPNSAMPPTSEALAENHSGELGIGVWAQLNNPDAYNRFLFDVTVGNVSLGLYMSVGTPQLNLYANNEVGSQLITSYTIPGTPGRVDTWHYFAANFRDTPRTGGNFLELFYDGVLVASLSPSSATLVMPFLSSATRPRILLGNDNSGWTGQYNDFQVYDHCLSASQVAANYAAQPIANCPPTYVNVTGSLLAYATGTSNVLPCLPSRVSMASMVSHGTGSPSPGSFQTLATLTFTLDEI